MAKNTSPNKRAAASAVANREPKKLRVSSPLNAAVSNDATDLDPLARSGAGVTTPSEWSHSTLDDDEDVNHDVVGDVVDDPPVEQHATTLADNADHVLISEGDALAGATVTGHVVGADGDVGGVPSEQQNPIVGGNELDDITESTPDLTLVGHHPKFEGLLYVPLPDLERACGFAVKNDPQNRRYALSQLPANAQWGTSPATERYLTDENNGLLTGWIIGRVRSKWFFNLWGEPQNRVNIAVTLPFKEDDSAMARLMQQEVPTVIYASRFQTKRNKGEQEATVMPFRNVYDARERFRAKSSMPLLEASQLGRGDLVLVEVLINRYKTAKDKKNRKAWTLWDVAFELQSVSLLFEAPAGLEDEDVPVANDSIDDDM